MSNSVFVKVSVKDELPPKQAFYTCFRNNDNVFMGQSWWDGYRFPLSDITHWLKMVVLPESDMLDIEADKLYPYRKEADNACFYYEGFSEGAQYILNLLTPNKDGKRSNNS